MFQKQCRLTIADKFYGGGSPGGGNPIRKPGQELPKINQFEQDAIAQFNSYFSGQPLLGGASQLAQAGYGMVPGLQGQIMGDQSQLGGLFGQLGGLSNQLGRFSGQLGGLSGALGGNIGQLNALLGQFGREQGVPKDILAQVDPIIKSGGALTPAMERDVAQATRAQFAASGNVTGNQALGSELLNRNQYQQQRFNTAVGQALPASQQLQSLSQAMQGVLGQEAQVRGEQAGILGQQAGIAGQRAGITGLQSGIVGQEAGLTGELQNIIGRAIQPGLATQQTGTGTFSQLADPMIGYLSNLFSGNQQARVATNQANQGKTAGLIGGGINAIGSILPLLAFSDERIKEKIRDTGEVTAQGFPLKAFQYKGDPKKRRFIGVMAQDVEETRPDAVVHDQRGVKMVNLSSLNVPFFEVATED